jgi:uncharacterized protein YneF (UPF0154 family)
MKKIKFLSIVIFLFVGMFVFFQSCQRESLETSQISNQSTSNDLFMKVISLDELLSENNKDVSFKSVEHLFKKNRINQRIDATDNSFSILTDDIVVTSYQDSLNSYSFVIETPTDSTSVFENFIIKEEAISQYSYWIFRYKYNFNNSNFDITYQNIDQEVINLDDFSNILSRQTYQLFIQGGCLYVQYWIYYSSNDYWGWSSPFLVFCGGAGNSSGSSGSSNDTNNDPNDYGEYNHFQGGSLEFYDANGESGIGSSNDNDSSSNEIDPILGTNIPIDFQLTLQLAYLLNIDVFDSNNQQWINQVESLIKTQDKINIIQFILDNNSSQQALEFANQAVVAEMQGGEVDFENRIIFSEIWENYPCQKEIVRATCSGVGQIGSEMQLIFTDNDIFEQEIFVNYNVADIPPDAYSQPLGETTYDFDSNVNLTDINITFHTQLIEQSTDLGIFVTALHENLHALIATYLENNEIYPDGGIFDSTNANATLSALVVLYAERKAAILIDENENFNTSLTTWLQHEIIAELVSIMKDEIKLYGESKGYVIDDFIYECLAWTGLQGTDAFSEYTEDDSVIIDAVLNTLIFEYTNNPLAHGQICD